MTAFTIPNNTIDLAKLIQMAKARGIVYLALFGSAARGEMSPQSDIDLIARFAHSSEIGYLALLGIEQELSDAMGRPVQLFTENEIHPYIRETVDKDRTILFELETDYASG